MSKLDIVVAGRSLSIEDAQKFWGYNLPTEQGADNVQLVTQESLLGSLSEKMNISADDINTFGAYQIFEDVLGLLQTMLTKEKSGELVYVSPVSDNGQEMPGGYQLIKKELS